MAQIPPPPRTYSPALPAQQTSPPPPILSPSTDPTFRAFKRQRLSPNPTSPVGLSPGRQPDHQQSYFQNHTSLANPSLPQTNGGPVMAAQPGAGGAMGPPSKPVDKPTSTAALTDVLAQAGINTLDEDAALLADFSTSRADNAAASFGSTSSGESGSGTLSGSLQPGPNVPPSDQGLRGLAQPYQNTEQLAKERWQASIRAHAASKQHHLDNPFLLGNTVRSRAWKCSHAAEVRLPQEGWHQPAPHPPPGRIQSTSSTAQDGTSITSVSVQGGVLERNAPLTEILALISLATEERIRGLIEDAAALCKARQVGSHGVVPPDFQDIILGEPTPKLREAASTSQEAALGTNGTSAAINPLKRSHTAANLHTSMTIPNTLAESIRNIASADRRYEEARLAKRARKASAASTNPSTPSGGTPGTATPADPGTPSVAPAPSTPPADPNTGKKMTKKEQAKQQSQKLDVVHQQQSANKTARMMLGGGGGLFGKKKKAGYSWMMNDAESGTSTPTRPGGGLAVGTPARFGSGPGGSAVSGPAVAPGGRRMGEWREDRDKGKGIQLRDLLGVLEEDGKVARAFLTRLWGLAK